MSEDDTWTLGDGDIEIDLSGPDGNAFFLASHGRAWARDLGWSRENISVFGKDILSSDYAHVLVTFVRYFGDLATLSGVPGPVYEEVTERLERLAQEPSKPLPSETLPEKVQRWSLCGCPECVTLLAKVEIK